MGFDPTAEQDAAIAAFRTGQHIALEAGAGTGKTSTLRLLASAVPAHADGRPRTGIYMAYNASIAKQAAREFPANTVCKTGHAHTMRALNPIQRARLFDMPRQHAGDHARILRAQDPARISPDVVFSPRQIAGAAMETITWFCRSGDTELKARHVPHRNRIESPSDRATLARIVLPFAQRAWNDITSTGGLLKWEHDYYRKMFHLNGGRLDGDFLFLDEAQDSNGVTIAIVRAHQAAGMRVVAVGDRCQSINGWMGAVDAMDAFNGARLQLSKSFRFGPAIATEANKWLTLLGSDLSISGHEPVGSKVGNLRGNTIPDAILTRKNATAVAEAMRLLDTGVKVALVKTVGDQIKRLAEAAQQLKARGSTDHPELCAFESWGQVQDYVEFDHGGSDLKVFVKLVDEHSPEKIIAAMRRLSPAEDAQVTISTAHRAKGLEWDRVRIADDFDPPEGEDEYGRPKMPSREDMMLAYVAVTRAKKVLDPGGLAWVDRFLAYSLIGNDRAIRSAVADMERGVGVRHGRYLRDAV